MIGGYFSFQGIDGRSRGHRTTVEEAMPVDCLPHNDRMGCDVHRHLSHPILEGVEGEWPLLLGANEVRIKKLEGVEVLANLPADQGGHPLLVTGTHGKGCTLAWTSDISPHWLPAGFYEWPDYPILWRNIVGWLTKN